MEDRDNQGDDRSLSGAVRNRQMPLIATKEV